jgi:hypothetical protein
MSRAAHIVRPGHIGNRTFRREITLFAFSFWEAKGMPLKGSSVMEESMRFVIRSAYTVETFFH